jgi:ATP-binding cassette subfamily B protein
LDGSVAHAIYSVVFLVQLLLWPLTRLGETFDLYQRAMASTHRVMELLDTPITTYSGNISLAIDAVRGEVEN